MSRPGDEIHDITHSYGYLWLPVWWSRKYGIRWLMRSERRYWALTTAFHNCRATGVH